MARGELLLALAAVFFCFFVKDIDGRSVICSGVKYTLDLKGIDHQSLPSEAIEGEELVICERGPSCCTSRIESALHNQSKSDFQDLVERKLMALRNSFAQHLGQFENYVWTVLRNSRSSFHTMFLRTYGKMYEDNAEMFREMFDFLDNFYDTGKGDVEALMAKFFERLYRKMFQVLNNQYHLSPSYLDCAVGYMNDLAPFGDVPRKITFEVKRSFIATRVYVSALRAAQDFLRATQNTEMPPSCSQLLMKMTYCPYCAGRQEVACPAYCLRVVRECLGPLVTLHEDWRKFTDAMSHLANRLMTTFNIETIMEPINIKISEGVMNFQEKGNIVSKSVFKHCGQPRLGKRQAPSEFSTTPPGPARNQNSSIQGLLEQFRSQVRRANSFWSELPGEICQDLPTSQRDCWSGSEEDSRKDPIYIDDKPRQARTSKHLAALRFVTQRMNDAYNGADVRDKGGIENLGEDLEGSGGSGSGSGNFPDDTEGDDDYDTTTSNVSYLPPVYVSTKVPSSVVETTTTTTTPEPTGSATISILSPILAAFAIVTALVRL